MSYVNPSIGWIHPGIGISLAWYGWVISHMWMSHVTHLNAYASYHTCECVWVVSHMLNVYESCHKCERAMSHMRMSHLHMWMSHVTCTNESCHIYEWVMLHVWMTHILHLSGLYHTCEWVMCHTCEWGIHSTWITHVSESYTARVSHMWVSHTNCMIDARVDYSFFHVYAMTYSHMCHNSSMCFQWLIHMYDMKHS